MPITPPFSIAAFNSGFDIKSFNASTLGASPIIVILFELSTERYTPVLLKPNMFVGYINHYSSPDLARIN